ncbi:serine hydrolase domain-containing protein [Streptomyces avidinii]|uniref:CubicO group peptidase (Beta-lactamase class C family) n=1 Tax=Streptomyces avidinii TaxID=1895 RepID=A0ABS4KX34_STRAV|nr:serine hydrolase domain-containing protein [Streptomyces avidinii]MBP2034591.1 CubicO group peptidase (beta-lactamase class C family) [Streptomyces avidinii]GGY87429.1 serine hydrolase [Streptomyces avidinii]
MSDLHSLLETQVGAGSLAGAVALVAHGQEVEVAAVGSLDSAGTAPMARDSLFRVASVTKPVTAAATMMLVEDGLLALDVPVARWLPELAEPTVVRTPSAPLDDVVPAGRPITVADLLTFRAGYGFPADFSLPAVAPLFAELKQGPPRPRDVAAPDAWMAALGRIPLLYQPGEAWLYNTCSDILGVLIARATGQPFQDVLAERVFEPLGMRDTAFAVPPGQLHRFTSYYRAAPDGASLELVDAPDGQWSTLPSFPSGAGGLVSTVDDLHAFFRMLLAGGSYGGGRLLAADSVRQMTTDHLTAPQRAAGALFLEGQGWGFGGSVDVARLDPWNVPGRYGWIGGTGTAAHIVPATGTVTLLLTQRELTGPASPEVMREFWTYAAARPGL